MRKFTLSIALCIFSFYSLFAAAPTVPASNIQFPVANLDGNQFTVRFNKGNGNFRIIVVKAGSAINSLPINGTEYTAVAAFGHPTSVFSANDGYVVYKGSTSNTTYSHTVTNLQPGTTYYVSIFEYNGAGVTTEYLMIGLTGNVTTKSAPAGQATITGFSLVAGNKLNVNWSVGTGERRLLIARKGAPVNVVPQDLEDYSHSTQFGSGEVINGDNYVVYKGQSNSATITNLEPNTTYHFALFEYNGNNGPVYLTPGSIANRLTNAGPTQASGTINFSNIEGNRLTLSFGAGNGKHQLIVARQGQAPTFVPINGQTYTPNTAFGTGTPVAPGEYVLNTIEDDRTFTNLAIATNYYFRIYDFDVDLAGNTYYLTSTYSQNNASTASAPTEQASNVRFENVTGSSMTIRHDAGISNYRLIIMKAGSPVDATPQNLVRYNGNQHFTSGDQIPTGNFVMTAGQNSTTLPVTGLTPGVTYHVAVFGFNGNNYPVYATPAATNFITIPNQPTTPGNNWHVALREGNSMRVQWTGGNGSRRLVIARKDAPVSVTPTDGATYTASPVFGDGTAIADGQFVVYDDVNRLIDMEDLEPGTTYHFAVFEYNISGGSPDYLVSSSLTGTGTTVSAPTSQTSGMFASNVQNTQALINFAVGNGTNRLFIMRAGSPVNAEPADLTFYNASPTYGTHQIGTGNYIVQRTNSGAAFTVTSLQPNTTYYVSAFEFNGSSAPVYMRPGASFSFTTTGTGITPPATHASSPSYPIIDGNKLRFDWSSGDGAKRIVVARQGSAVNFTPTNGVDYTANPSFSNGTDQGNGQYVVYNGSGNNVTITNLSPATTYHFAVFEYNGANTTATYLINGALATNRSTAVTPAAGSTAITGTASGLTLQLSWNSGPGSGRMVVMKEGNAVNGTPSDLSDYPDNPAFGSGAQIGTGEFVVYSGSGNSITVTGLSANKTYHYTIFEYNGVDAPMFNTVNKVSNSTLIPSTLPLTWLYFTATENNNQILLKWGTANESNTSHFIIERSTGNGNFTQIDSLQAAGIGNHDYTYTDHTPLAGTVSYRIKQVDIDNRFTYSRQVVVKAITSQDAIKLYPNPAPGYTRIGLPQGWQQATLQVFTMEGRLVKNKIVVNGEMISLQEMVKGMYNVVVDKEGKKFTAKLIVQ